MDALREQFSFSFLCCQVLAQRGSLNLVFFNIILCSLYTYNIKYKNLQYKTIKAVWLRGVYQITEVQTVVHFSDFTKQTLQRDGYTGLSLAAHCITLHLQLFNSVSSHSLSFMFLRSKPYSWPNKAWSHQKWCFGIPQCKPSDISAMPQQEKCIGRLSQFCFHGFWKAIEKTLGNEMREGRHGEKTLQEETVSLLGLVWSHRNQASQPSPGAEPRQPQWVKQNPEQQIADLCVCMYKGWDSSETSSWFLEFVQFKRD